MVTAKTGYDFKSGRKKFQIMKSKSVIMALQGNNNEAEVDEKLEALCKSLIKTYGDQLGGEIFEGAIEAADNQMLALMQGGMVEQMKARQEAKQKAEES